MSAATEPLRALRAGSGRGRLLQEMIVYQQGIFWRCG